MICKIYILNKSSTIIEGFQHCDFTIFDLMIFSQTFQLKGIQKETKTYVSVYILFKPEDFVFKSVT